MPKWSSLASFWNPQACGQTILPDRQVILIGQKLVEHGKKNSNETFWMVFKQCAKEDRGGPLSWTILFLCFFSIVSDVMRCIPRVLEQNPKIGCFRSISRVSWNLLTLEREVEQRNLIFGVCFFKEKDILEFPLEKRCKRKKEECRTKDHRASSSHLCF